PKPPGTVKQFAHQDKGLRGGGGLDRDSAWYHPWVLEPGTPQWRRPLMAFQHVGRPIKRVEDPKLITGPDHYVNDVRLSNALTAACVRSPHAHAVIKNIDTRAARAIPGVVAVLTHADVNAEVGVIHTPIPPEMFGSMNRQGYTMLAEGRVRHVGQPVAVVAAET